MRRSTLFGALAVGAVALLGGTPAPAEAQHTIQCASQEEKRTLCEADTSGGVYLTRQLSNDLCIYGETWGVTPDAVWVSSGCRGEFMVDLPPSSTPVSAADALRICRNRVVARLGLLMPSVVEVDIYPPDSQGGRSVGWSTDTGWAGSCRVAPDGSITGFTVEQRGQ